MKTDPRQEHRWLQQFLGDWTIDGEAAGAPGAPPEKFRGSERVRAFGDLWIVGEGEMGPEGEPGRTLLALGFDARKGRFTGSFVATPMDALWVYDGALDPSGKALALECEGPDMTGAGTAKYRDTHRFESADHRVLTSELLGPDGKWVTFMTAHYRR